ncbi:hypothetical protein [Streptomyces sp. NPDC058434]|uniref:hypothetical protein n=1 Tax=Streptomyces sp. NPDC058434 TaxID=3346498 RepID=UPI003651C3C4
MHGLRVSLRRLPWTKVIAYALPVPLGLALSGGLVWRASHAAFAGVTSNSGNRWSAGSLNLTNDSGGLPMFQITNMTPGQSGSRCIAITSSSTLPANIKLYSSHAAVPANDISPYINLTIEDGTGGTFNSCAGFTPNGATDYTGTLDNFLTTRTNYANGVGPWAVSGSPPQTISYRITWTFSASAPDTTQGGSTPNVSFNWEAQTT